MHWSNLLSSRSRYMRRLWCWKLQEFRVGGLHMHHLPRWNHLCKWFGIRLHQLSGWKVPCGSWRIIGRRLSIVRWNNLLSFSWSHRLCHLSRWIGHRCR